MTVNYDDYIGKYVVLRTWAAGVHIGELKSYDPANRQGVLLNSRRIWRWEGAFTLSEVSQNGIKDGKIAITLPEILVTQIEEIIPCSQKATDNIRNFPVYVP